MRRFAALALVAVILAACQPPISSSNSLPSAASTPATSAASTAAPDASTSLASPSGSPTTSGPGALPPAIQRYPVRAGSHPHDVAPASDGGVWYTGQNVGTLGWLDPATGAIHEVDLGDGAAPHGVISGPDGAAWVTDQGLEAIVRVTPGDYRVDVFDAPAGTSPHTAVFDLDGILWFTGAGGWIGRLDPAGGQVQRYPVPRGSGPYGITVTPSNDVWFVSLQQSYVGHVDKATGQVEVIDPPTAGAGTRRVWSDSNGWLWISYWNAGMLAMYDPATKSWREWDLPGDGNQGYSMYVDETDAVWISDFGQNAVHRFDPTTETFDSFRSDRPNANVRQMLGRDGEAWAAESGLDRLIVFRYGR